MHNCPNCGAPLEPYKCHCEYCGTYYFDLAAFDCTKKCFVKFKLNSGGQDYYVTALAVPTLKEAEFNTETRDCVDPLGHHIATMFVSQTCDLHVDFTCLVNPKDKTLFKLEKSVPQI